MDEILKMIIEIKEDLTKIKIKLGLETGHHQDQDQDQDHDQDLDLFKKDLSDHDLILNDDQIRCLERSIRYYLKNRWKINNRKAYIEKMIKEGLKKPVFEPIKHVQEDNSRHTKEGQGEILAVKWNSFNTWDEFVRHTLKIDSVADYASYEMPDRIRKMRNAPGMTMLVMAGNSPKWAETEYAILKKVVENEPEQQICIS